MANNALPTKLIYSKFNNDAFISVELLRSSDVSTMNALLNLRV